MDGLRGEDSIAELCRREGISQGIYYKWSKDFMEAGKKRLVRIRLTAPILFIRWSRDVQHDVLTDLKVYEVA